MALTDNLVAYWKLDEASGNATDSVGSNTLTNVNSASFVAGKINNGALTASSGSKYFSIADASQSGLDFGTGDFTFNLWLKPVSISDGDVVLSKISGAGYYLRFEDNTGNKIRLMTASGGETFVVTTSAGISSGNWSMVTVKRNGTTLSIKINNGTAVTATGTVRNGDNTTAFVLGAGPDGVTPFNGILDEVAVWNRATTDDEDTQLYNGGAGLTYPFSTSTPNFLPFFQQIYN